ncbi:MAG: amidohydrolase [Deltaproteobacteria bacterium]|nr:amidohydrolase [Deltaproteobacteria bacterium]
MPIVPCCADTGSDLPRPAINDVEGPRVPSGLPEVVDAHVHLFPDRVFHALWAWFDGHGWPIRYRLETPRAIEFLLSRGVSRIVALSYSHKAGMARSLNSAMAEVARAEPRVIGLATVFPGEPEAREILEEAFALGLRGVKLHCHVQAFSPDAEELGPIYEQCARADLPLVMHAGRAPRSTAYPIDPHVLCHVDRVRAVLEDHPRLKLVVPHLGADELDAYADLLERHDNLWLDTTMMLAGFFDLVVPHRIFEARPDRIMYGSDFPNLPYAWDRELVRVRDSGIPEASLARVLSTNARALFDTHPASRNPC